MSFNKDLDYNAEINTLSDDKLLEHYYNMSNYAKGLSYETHALILAYELQRRENEKTNKKIRNWTIAIGIMTAVMLLATILNVLISKGII